MVKIVVQNKIHHNYRLCWGPILVVSADDQGLERKVSHLGLKQEDWTRHPHIDEKELVWDFWIIAVDGVNVIAGGCV